jgi:hemerythrin superfamily protein
MMSGIASDLSRRALGFGTIGLAAFAAMSDAVAQTMAAGGNWFDMIKAHHVLIAQNLDQILATRDDQVAERMRLQKRLGYLLTAHSVAEENVIYPAVARMGMTGDSDRLYMEQAQAKVVNADLGMSPAGTTVWRDHVSALKTAILHHAKVEEEADIFPRLMQSAGPELNAKLTQGYQQQFASVSPV